MRLIRRFSFIIFLKENSLTKRKKIFLDTPTYYVALKSIFHPQSVSLKESCISAEQTLLSRTSDRCSLSSIGLDPGACHLSHLNGPRGDLSVPLELHTLLVLTQSNARSAFGGRSDGSH